MKTGKKFLSVLLAVLMFMSIVPMSDMGIEANAVSYVTVSGHTVVDSITFNGATTQAVYKEYYGSGYNSDTTYCCAAFVKRFYANSYGINVWNLTYQQTPTTDNGSFSVTTSPKVGDIVRRNSKTHWMIVKAVNGSTITLIEQNWWTSPYTQAPVNRTISTSNSDYTFFRYSKATDGGSGGGSSSGSKPIGAIDHLSGGVGVLNVSGWAFDADDKSAQLNIHVYIGDEGHGWITANKERTDVNKVHGCGDYHGFSETIKTAKSGEQKVEIYAINVGGGSNKLLHSETVYITPDNESPTISNIAVRNSPTGILITCNVSDDVGVGRVRFPTWTSYNGQDDVVWHEGNINPDGKSAWCQINKTDHNEEVGVYYTDIYVYDIQGNKNSYKTIESYVGDLIKFHDITTADNGILGIDISGTPTISKQVKFWFVEYDMDTNYYIDILVDGNKVVSNSSSDANGYISYVIDTTTMSNGVHSITADLYDTYAKYSVTKKFNVGNTFCTVEFQSYSESGTNTKTVTYGGVYGTLPTPVRKGYVFDGWYTQAIGGTKVTSSTKVTTTGNHNLYAHWTTQNVYFNNNYGTTAVNYFRPNNCFDISTQTLNFNGTYTDNAIIDLVPFTPVAGEVYKVTATLVSGSMGSGYLVLEGCDAGIVNMSASEYGGERVHIDIRNSSSRTWTITSQQAKGLSLLKVWIWASDGKSVDFNNYKVKIKIEKVSSASASATSYTPAAQYAKKGSTYGTLPTPTRSGYNFDGWYTAASGGTKVSSSTKVTATGNHTLYAHWTCKHGTTEIKNAKSASCTAEGYTGDTYCKTCGVKTKSGTVIAKTAHNSNTTIPAVAATCTKTGLTEGKKCSVCGTVTVAQQTIAKTAHSYTSKVTTVANCTKEGVRTFTCSSCGTNYTEVIAKDMNNHRNPIGGSEIRNQKSATCTAEGYTGDTYCKGCGAKIKSGTVIAKLAHKYTSEIVKQPTCNEKGLEIFSCKCGDSYTKEIKATGHSYGDDGICKDCDDYNAEADKGNESDSGKNCSHICHKTGFMGFIWKILLFIFKLFKISPVCDCGVAHY